MVGNIGIGGSSVADGLFCLCVCRVMYMWVCFVLEPQIIGLRLSQGMELERHGDIFVNISLHLYKY